MLNSFEQSLLQLKKAGQLAKINKKILTILSRPQREINITLPPLGDKHPETIQAYRVQYNNALGPYKGGIRFHQNVDLAEVKTLAFLMTLKTALFKLPLGGGKGGVVINPKKFSQPELKKISVNFVKLLFPLLGPNQDIPAPDVYTNPQIMEWMTTAYGELAGKKTPAAFTGKPLKSGGSQGRTEATGFGAFYTLLELTKKLNKKPSTLTIAIQGFGNAGYYFALACFTAGFKIVAIADSQGGVFDQSLLGLDPKKVMEAKKAKGYIDSRYSNHPTGNYKNYKSITNAQLLALPVDILAPAALGGALNGNNARKVKAKIIVEIANDGITHDAQNILGKRKIIIIPDILANAGGVIVSYFEYVQNLSQKKWTQEQVLKKLEKMMKQTFAKVWQISEDKKTDLRTAAWIIALQNIAKKIK